MCENIFNVKNSFIIGQRANNTKNANFNPSEIAHFNPRKFIHAKISTFTVRDYTDYTLDPPVICTVHVSVPAGKALSSKCTCNKSIRRTIWCP